MRIVVVVTARPSWARIQTACEALRATNADLTILAAAAACAPRYGAVVSQIRAEGYTVRELPGLWDDAHPAGMAVMTGHLTAALAQVLRDLAPDAVVTIADRYETLATAIAASYQNLPLVHIQGGEVTGSIDDKVRHAITQLADLHLVATDQARVRIEAAGARGPVVVTGCPSIDLALRVREAERISRPPLALPGIGPDVDMLAPFLLVLHHPDTRHWETAQAETQALLEAVEATGHPCVWFWPNIDAGAAGVEKVLRVAHERGAAIRFVRHVPPEDFLRLMVRCRVMIGNSSASVREGSALGTRALLLGTRQEGRETGPNVVRLPGATHRAIAAAWGSPAPAGSPVYGDGHAGVRIAEAIRRWHSVVSPLR